jgi:hypothetical protein
MNTHLKNVKLILKGQPAQSLDSMSVRGNQIRSVTFAFSVSSFLTDHDTITCTTAHVPL